MLTESTKLTAPMMEEVIDPQPESINSVEQSVAAQGDSAVSEPPPNVREVNLDSVMKELTDYMNLISTEQEDAELRESVLTALAVYDDYQVPRLMRTKVKEAAEALVRNRILGVNVDAIVQQVTKAYSSVTPVSETDAAAFSGLSNYILQILDAELKLGPTKIKNILFLSMFVGLKK